jgi:hypothetical protein
MAAQGHRIHYIWVMLGGCARRERPRALLRAWGMETTAGLQVAALVCPTRVRSSAMSNETHVRALQPQRRPQAASSAGAAVTGHVPAPAHRASPAAAEAKQTCSHAHVGHVATRQGPWGALGRRPNVHDVDVLKWEPTFTGPTRAPGYLTIRF